MARDSGIKVGAGGRSMLQEIVEEPKPEPKKEEPKKK